MLYRLGQTIAMIIFMTVVAAYIHDLKITVSQMDHAQGQFFIKQGERFNTTQGKLNNIGNVTEGMQFLDNATATRTKLAVDNLTDQHHEMLSIMKNKT